MGVASYTFFNADVEMCGETSNPKINHIAVPVTIVTIGSFLVAKVFFDVFGIGVQSLMLCFVIDMDVNDGSAEKPYFMGKHLQAAMALKTASALGKKVSENGLLLLLWHHFCFIKVIKHQSSITK